MKNLEEVAVYIVTGLVITAICWLTKEVLSLRKDLTKLQTEVGIKIADIAQNCNRHQRWSEALQTSLGRVDRNMIRLCAKLDVDYEEPKDSEQKGGQSC